MRNIDENTYKDLWYRDLPTDRKLTWLGMISFLADDQGRFLVDLVEIRYAIFGGDITVSDEFIMNIIDEFATDQKVFSYDVNGKKYCQLKNWWRYQIHASYMFISKLPAPPNWFDRFCYTGKGRKNIKSTNWDTGIYGYQELINP